MRNQIQQQPDEHHSVDWATTRPVVSGSGGVISSGHPLVSMAGMRMLLLGGNAFDAADPVSPIVDFRCRCSNIKLVMLASLQLVLMTIGASLYKNREEGAKSNLSQI
jgi:hypothetical protein